MITFLYLYTALVPTENCTRLGGNREVVTYDAFWKIGGLTYCVYSLLLWTTLIGLFMILIWQLDGVCLPILIKSALLFSDAGYNHL